MHYMVEHWDGSGRWVPYAEPIPLKRSELIVRKFDVRNDAQTHCNDLNRRVPGRAAPTYRVVFVQRSDQPPAEYKWVGDGKPSQDVRVKAGATLEKRRAALAARLLNVAAEIAELEGYTEVVCTGNCHGPGCGASLYIRDLIYIQTHWYVRPYSCSEGDYWNAGEGNFLCPQCGHRNRLYERKDIEALKRHFYGVTDEHAD
jgi:hypothetical protein